MTRSDKWKERTCVMRYWEFKDEIVRQARDENFNLPDVYNVCFHIPMPATWSKKKKDKMRGTPHMQKPDIDNIIKSLNDSLKDEDSTIHEIHAVKKWGDVGIIEIDIKVDSVLYAPF